MIGVPFGVQIRLCEHCGCPAYNEGEADLGTAGLIAALHRHSDQAKEDTGRLAEATAERDQLRVAVADLGGQLPAVTAERDQLARRAEDLTVRLEAEQRTVRRLRGQSAPTPWVAALEDRPARSRTATLPAVRPGDSFGVAAGLDDLEAEEPGVVTATWGHLILAVVILGLFAAAVIGLFRMGTDPLTAGAERAGAVAAGGTVAAGFGGYHAGRSRRG